MINEEQIKERLRIADLPKLAKKLSDLPQKDREDCILELLKMLKNAGKTNKTSAYVT